MRSRYVDTPRAACFYNRSVCEGILFFDIEAKVGSDECLAKSVADT